MWTSPAAAKQFARLLLDVLLEVTIAFEDEGGFRGEPKERLFHRLCLAGRRGDDERRAGLVDQDVVGLVDEGEPVGTLQQAGLPADRLAGERGGEVTATVGHLAVHEPVFQEVEAEFLGGAVGHVASVGLATLVEVHLRLDDPHLEPERLVDRLHPLRVAAGEVIVHGGEVRAPPRERVEHQRKRRDEGFSLAGLHLEDRAVDERRAGEDLDVVMPHAQAAASGLARGGEAVDEERVDRLTRLRAVCERASQSPERRVVEHLHRGRKLVHAAHELPQAGMDGRFHTGREAAKKLEHLRPRPRPGPRPSFDRTLPRPRHNKATRPQGPQAPPRRTA